jgi:peroxiredoxin
MPLTIREQSEQVKAGDELEPFTLDDATGNPIGLLQLVESDPAVIVFYRGGWCP